jgi:hypothetical protein
MSYALNWIFAAGAALVVYGICVLGLLFITDNRMVCHAP